MEEQEDSSQPVIVWRIKQIESKLDLLTVKFDALWQVVTSAQGSMKVISIGAVTISSMIGALASIVIQKILYK